MSYAFLAQIADLTKRLDAAEARLSAVERVQADALLDGPERIGEPVEAAEPDLAPKKRGWPAGRPRKLPGNGIVAVSATSRPNG